MVYSATFLLSVPNTTSESASIMILHPGMDFHLSCVSSGILQPLLTWYRDGVVLMDGSGGVSIVSSWNTSELTVTDTGGQQGGEYNCSGTNAAGLSSLAFTVECKTLFTLENLIVSYSAHFDCVGTLDIGFSHIYLLVTQKPFTSK